jgi:lipopolysaccharide/colanic/teichoic acid biosynthesis glycosyltransferase/O-antigen/teichoic acid export membrane protein
MTMTMTMTHEAAPPRQAEAKPARGSAQRAAVIMLVLAIIFQPILHPTGPGNSSPVDLLVVAAIVTAAVWLAGTHQKLRAPYFFPVALFVIAGAASGLVSSLPTTALLTLAIDILLFAWCTTMTNVLSGPRAMRTALKAWSWAGMFWACVVIVAWLGHVTKLEGLTPAEGNRVMFTFGDPNYASWYWDSTIFVLFASRTPGRRWMRILGYLLLVWALVLSESNGGVLALGLGISFLVMVRHYRRHGWAGVLATGLVVGLAVGTFFTVLPLNSIRQWALYSGQPLLVNSIGRSAQSSNERGLLIQETIELYRTSHGVTGLGPASTKPLLTTGLYPYANEAHNDWLAALVERGVLGLGALLLLAGCVIARAGPAVRRPLSAPMAAAVPAPAGIVAAILAVSINSFYEEVLHFRPLWMLFGIAAVLGRDALRAHKASQQRRYARLRPAALTRVITRPPAKVADGNGRPLTPYIPPHPAAFAAPAVGGASRHFSSAAVMARLPAPVRALIPAQAGTSGSKGTSKHVITNLGAQGGALACASIASLLVARIGGPTVLGYWSLLRVLPWLFGVVISCGLPTASAFFLAGEHGKDRRVRPTLAVMAVVGAGASALAWLACAVPFQHVFFKQMPLPLVVAMTIYVVTSLWNVTAKACCQGSGDIPGANLLIVAEEFWFLPVYVALRIATGQGGSTLVVASMIISGGLYFATAVLRLWARGFFSHWGRPSFRLAGRITAFGARGQLGNMLWLTNLRFDFVLLGALAGPAVLGVYAVASKFAELMRLVPTAVNYVQYPTFARLGRVKATAEARKVLPLITALTVLMTPLLAVGTYIAVPILYGKAYHGAILPAEIIIIGLSIEGAAAVSSAYLLGLGRPGLNSVGMGVGAIITVTLDVILIPRLGAMGGAITSAVTYLTTTMVLVLLARRQFRLAAQTGDLPPAKPKIVGDSWARRAVDIVVSGTALAIVGPVIVLLACLVRLTSRGPAFYRQVRVGRAVEQFTMLKLRSMVTGADQAGPLVTSREDSRVTKLGVLLRAAKLDELPQLINVLKGDMTLIGPRPEVPRFIPYYDDEELQILNVRPGLTGPGQIFYTEVQKATTLGEEDPEQHYASYELHPKLAIDLDYLRRRSAGHDLKILVRTALLLAGLAKPAPAPGAPAADEPVSPARYASASDDDDAPTLVMAPYGFLRPGDAPTILMAPCAPPSHDDEMPTMIFGRYRPPAPGDPSAADDPPTMVMAASRPSWPEDDSTVVMAAVPAARPDRAPADPAPAGPAGQDSRRPAPHPAAPEAKPARLLTVAEALPATIVASGKLGRRSRRLYLTLLTVVMAAAATGSILVFWIK